MHLGLIEWAKQHNIILFVQPPHSSHFLQPLDIGVYGPLKNAYHSLVHSYLKQHPGQVINRYNITSLICQSYIKASTPSNIVNSFLKTGIYPFNPEVIDPVHFMPSKMTQRSTDDITLDNEENQDISHIQDCDIDTFLESHIPKVKVSQATKKRRRDPAGEALTEGNYQKSRKVGEELCPRHLGPHKQALQGSYTNH